MSIPGLSIPGLDLSSTNPLLSDSAPAAPASRTQSLAPNTEYRFETSFSAPPVTIKIVTGTAELFGTELAPQIAYTFHGAKAAIYTWQGCQLEVTGDVEGEYVAEETPVMQYANVHFALENLRHQGKGPRVLIVGAENSGKTSLAKFLTAYAVKSGRQLVGVNLDPRQGMLSVPGSLTAATMAGMLDVEEGWGSSPISGPTSMPVKMPLVYHFGCATAEENTRLWKSLATRLALAVKSRSGEDQAVREGGVIIDTPGGIASGKAGNYDLIQHVISEFDVNVLLVLGSERLFNDLKKKAGDKATVVRLDKSGGCVDRDEGYMQQLRQTQIREYFFGYGNMNLAPHSMLADYSYISVYRILSSSATTATTTSTADEEDDDFYEPSATIAIPTTSSTATGPALEKVTPTNMMQNSLLAVTFASPNASLDQIRDAAVMGYVYVAEVDEVKRKVKLLSPVGGAAPRNAMVWGNWPESVVSLVS